MKVIKNLLVALVMSVISVIAFAGQDTAMNVQLINLTSTTAKALTIDQYTAAFQYGPVVQGNSGNAPQWAVHSPGNRNYIGLLYTDTYLMCQQSDGYFIALNPLIYSGDTIKITYISRNGNSSLNCTCTGSACDTGLSRKHRGGSDI